MAAKKPRQAEKCHGNQPARWRGRRTKIPLKMASRRPITEVQPELEHAAATDAAEQILGANPLLGLDRDELLAARNGC